LASTASCAPAGRNFLDRLHPAQVLVERQAADLHLHHGVAGIEMAAHLVLQVRHGLAGPVPAAADVAKHLGRDLAAVVALGEQAMELLAGDLRHRVPERDLDRADGDRALAVAAGFLALHHAGEDARRLEVLAAGIEQRRGIGGEDAWDEAGAHLRAAGVAASRVERETRHRLAVAHHVGHDRNHRGGHLRKVETRVPDVGLERNRAFADCDNTHLGILFLGRCGRSRSAVPELIS
jgi:hypothetical protein